MIVLEVSYSELQEVRRKAFSEREQETMFSFSDGEGSGCLIEFNAACGYTVSSFDCYAFQRESGAVENIEDALDLAVALHASEPQAEATPWKLSLRSTARELRAVIEVARVRADEWPISSLVAPVDSFNHFA